MSGMTTNYGAIYRPSKKHGTYKKTEWGYEKVKENKNRKKLKKKRKRPKK
jgi:hypothetical protein